MNGLRATVFSVAIVVAIGCLGCRSTAVTAATGPQRQQRRLDRLRADDGDNYYCRTAAGWTLQCVVQKVVRTIRLLEDSDGFQIADGLRLVKTNTTDDGRSTKNQTSDVFDRMVSFVDGHSLEIDLWTPDNSVSAKGRRRHAYRKVFPIVVGTYMIMSAVLIPMGFMFMSTLGGKALLISKMALIISLMSNIKKIFSYEYYVPSAPAQPTGHHHHWKRTLQLAHRTTAGPLYSSYTAY